MAKKIIYTKNAPEPIGPYSQAVLSGNLLFTCGQICIDPVTGELNNSTIETEAIQVMENLKAVLAAASMDFSHVLKTTIFLSDMNLFAELNKIYGGYFASDYPARETVAVKTLPKNVNIEISMIASSA
ncbi:RidA family protein [soil metagenome]